MKSLITEPLGLYGWRRLEPVLLAALATEEPMLFVGPHGCAKSFILERLAESLKLAFRCYNASLINYDDLVGIPMPTKDRKGLDYISSPDSIWDAEVVFIDEISRTRPELQNKLFPIIHERRVQGRRLEKLRYRWAAMNPPCLDEDDDDGDAYFGSEPLDPALADRFPFVVEVPRWENLSDRDKREMLADQFAGRHEFPVDIGELVAKTKNEYANCIRDLGGEVSGYIIALMGLLNDTDAKLSARRATMLERTLLAIHAARRVLAEEGAEVKLYDSAQLALPNTLPTTARKSPDRARLVAVCDEAWKLSEMSEDDPERIIMSIADSVERFRKAVVMRDRLSANRIAELSGEGLGNAKTEHERRALALAAYLALRTKRDFPASAMELIVAVAKPVFQCGKSNCRVAVSKAAAARKVAQIAADGEGGKSEFGRYRDNLLNSFLPDGYGANADPGALADGFARLWKEFGL